ncbi:Hypothetical predicted protein [Mytilus galloprovincialis]|uniref:HECT domain-containing protein n=1 Tax=Mytilus galloprovincialis TaxID=29158 RepID=A0A8B6EYZ5_MYTGA|nr:Hypothetical predicted protein [Mytilus galloprovincialis]
MESVINIGSNKDNDPVRESKCVASLIVLYRPFILSISLIQLGLSVLEGGECPKYLNIMLAEKEAEEYQQFRRGLSKTGILQLLKEKPTIGYLFQQNSGRLTVGKLIHILKPEFAEAGTNKRTAEERLYSSFVKYIRKSAAGQRGQVTLEKILQFSTGSPEEPVLGFSIAPRVNFAAINGDFPTASTCINQLTLPVTLKNEDELFEKFDMAFMNNYFGLR